MFWSQSPGPSFLLWKRLCSVSNTVSLNYLLYQRTDQRPIKILRTPRKHHFYQTWNVHLCPLTVVVVDHLCKTVGTFCVRVSDKEKVRRPVRDSWSPLKSTFLLSSSSVTLSLSNKRSLSDLSHRRRNLFRLVKVNQGFLNKDGSL